MNKWVYWGISLAILVALGATWMQAGAHPGHDAPSNQPAAAQSTRSVPGKNIWNRGEAPEDWWAEVERYHGHVGPWNVLGWRIGQAALRDFGAAWGDHTLNIYVHIPRRTPYSCLIEGLMVGTGNSQGRLDLMLSEALSTSTIHVSIQRKSGGQTLVYRPHARYLAKIETRPANELELLSKECAAMEEDDLYLVEVYE